MARYLVTGGAGFIGSHIAECLVERGNDVVVFDNLSTGKVENLRSFRERVDFRKADLRDLAAVREACTGIDYVLHQGALASVPLSVTDPIASNEVNVTGTLNVLVGARDAGVRRVVYAASSSVYGDAPALPKHEDMPASPLSPYAIGKYTGELYCQVFAGLYGIQTVVLRYFNVFGPRQDPTSQYAAVVPRFIAALQEGESPTVYGDGEQSRDFIYVANVVEANLLACEAAEAVGQVINVACGESTSLNELLGILRGIIGADVPTVYVEPRSGDIKHSWADVSRASELLGHQVGVSLEDGLRRTAEWFAEQRG